MRIAAAVFAVCVSASLACNGDGSESLTLEEYFVDFDRLLDEHGRRSEAIEVNVSDIASVEEGQEAFAQGFGELRDVIDDLIGDLDDLNPPSEAAAAHDEYVERLKAGLQAADELAAEVAAAKTAEEVVAATDTSPFQEQAAKIAAACDDLQSIADENEIDVDLECEDS